MYRSHGTNGCLRNYGFDSRLGTGGERGPVRSAESPVAWKILCLTFLLLLLGSIYSQPVCSLPSDEKRVVRCLVFVEGNRDYEERVQSVFEQANKYLELEGAEMELVLTSSLRQIEFKGDTTRKMLNELRQAARPCSPEAWDLAIAFTNGPLQGPNGVNWSGVIEKRESRHIIIKCLNYNTLLHEIGHALGLPHGAGVMLSTLKNGYVPLNGEYRDAIGNVRTLLAARHPSSRPSVGSAAQAVSASLRLAQASRE